MPVAARAATRKAKILFMQQFLLGWVGAVMLYGCGARV